MRSFLFVILTCFCPVVLAQSEMKSNIIPQSPEGYDENEPVADKLIRLAWENYPINDVYEGEVNIAKRNLNMAGWTWTKNLSMFYNLNDQNLTEQQNQQNFSGRPIYGMGISVNIGDLISIPNNVNTVREEYKIAILERDAQKRQIRAEVLKLYNQYKLAKEILSIRMSNLNETETNLSVVEENFKNGDASMSEYNDAVEQYNESREKKLTQEYKVMEVKIDLEEYIGIPLEEVLNNNQ